MNENSLMPAPSVLMVTWEQPKAAAPPRVLLAGGISGLAGAIALPTRTSGLGLLVVAVVIAAAVVYVAVRREPARIDVAAVAWAVLALALVGVTVLRDATWLYALCLLGACMAGSLAVAGGKSPIGMLLGAFTVPVAALMSMPWVARGLRAFRRGVTKKTVRVTGSVAVSAGLLLVFVPLLAGADAAFARMLGTMAPTVDMGSLIRWVFLFVVMGFVAAGACLVLAAPVQVDQPARRPTRLGRVEWVLPVGLLVVLFTAFAAVQFAALFGGSEYVLRTSGLTYAEYARSGFWQLLAVTVLTLLVVAGAARWAPQKTSADRTWLRGLLGALSVLMLVVVASALTRMWVYQEAYGFTVLRLLVEACEVWLGIVYLLVIAAGVRLKAGWLPRVTVGTALAGLLVFAALDPERMIADRNVTRWQQTGQIDTAYLSRLSADAVPGLVRLPAHLHNCAIDPPVTDRDWRNWNASRSAAQDIKVGTCG